MSEISFLLSLFLKIAKKKTINFEFGNLSKNIFIYFFNKSFN